MRTAGPLAKEFRRLFTKTEIRRIASKTAKYGIDMLQWSTGDKG